MDDSGGPPRGADEGYPGAEYQPPRTTAELLPVLLQVTEAELAPFDKAMAPLLLAPALPAATPPPSPGVGWG